MRTQTPYLSIVVASRNDNHGQDLRKRMRLFLKSIDCHTREFQLPVELVIVEWNPPVNKALLHEVLPAPVQNPYLVIRYLMVPPEIHRRYQSASVVALMQMIAKNIGIRRSKAPFVLCTNVDIIFSRAVFRYLSHRPLAKGMVYRCNRCDVPAEVPEEGSIHHILRYCAGHIIQRLGKNRWMPHLNLPGRFWYQNPFTLISIALIAQIIRPFMSKKSLRYRSLDTWACGDFTLMHKEDWADIKGYLELDAYPIHIDSLALGAAVAMGKKQIIWPAKRCIYHISHQDSWELQDPLRKIYFDVRMPRMDYVTLQHALRHMIDKQQLISHTNLNWGYANRALTEYRVCSAEVLVIRPKSVSTQHLLV